LLINVEIYKKAVNVVNRKLITNAEENGVESKSSTLITIPLQVVVARSGNSYKAILTGNGAIAQGTNAKAVGEDGVLIEGGMVDSVFVKGDGNEINIGSEPRARTASLREAYLTYVLKEVSPLMLSGVVRQSAGEAETRMNLSAVYTALLTQSASEEIAELPEKVLHIRPLADMAVNKRMSVVEQMNRLNRMVLLGDPGSGKTTFVNFVALSMAGELLGRDDANINGLTQPLPQDQDEERRKKEEPKPQPWEHGALIPVRVILRDFAARGLPELGKATTAEHVWNFIEAELNAASLGEFASLLKKELRDQGGLILFDGLDEVPEAEHHREQMRSALECFAAAFPRCRYLVTSRTYAYQKQDWKLKGFDETVLASFTKEQIRNFVERWYEHITRLRGQNLEDGKGKAEALKHAIFASERLLSLAERPLLLTLMASLHAWRGGTLPDKRERLYADAVDLLLERWESQRIVRDPRNNVQVIQPSLAEWLKVDRDKVRDLLNQLAYEAHAGQSELTGTADVPEGALISGLMNLNQNPDPDVKPARLVEYLRDRAGLLIPRGVGVYTFPHRTFQEYLAACYLTDHDYPDLIASLARCDPNRWREAALLAGAKAASGAAVFALWSLVDSLTPERENGAGSEKYWGAQIAGQAVVEIADLSKVSDSTQTKIDRLRARLLDIMEGNRVNTVERVKAGNNLSTLGDPRFDADLWHLPKDETLGFVHIPAGKFLMGSDDKDDDNEKPKHEVHLEEFWMAKYPVTVGQYRYFVENSGYKTSDTDAMEGFSNHPVVYVTWYDVSEYTKWLNGELRHYAAKQTQAGGNHPFWQGLAAGKLHVTLPSEAEWEKAARDSDGRIYPWGNDFDAEKANTGETNIGGTSAVGCFPAGVSPYGLLDMSGNVWEWTRSLWGKDWSKPDYQYPYDPQDTKREDLGASKEILHVLRGGSFINIEWNVRCVVRGLNPDLRNRIGGFRLVVKSLFHGNDGR
jgi:formylglycine-generating enzyme required for sulfatase activity